MRVALIEDETDIADLYREILTAEGHEVWWVDQHHLGDVGDADVVIVDLMMPDVGGGEVLEWLRAHSNARRVVASAMFHVPSAVAQYADVVLTKPFTPSALLEAITS